MALSGVTVSYSGARGFHTGEFTVATNTLMSGFNVDSERVIQSERLQTNSTGEPMLFWVLHTVVPLKILGPGKTQRTLGACRWLDARVPGDMLLEAVMCREFSRTVVAGVLPVALVRSDMDAHFGLEEEPLVAVRAAERLLNVVCLEVLRQVLLLQEHSSAEVTRQGNPVRVL